MLKQALSTFVEICFYVEANRLISSVKCLVEQARQGDESSQQLLLERFTPLIQKCVRRARLILPHEHCDVLMAEANYLFLVLLKEFNPDRGVPFEGYIKAKLDLRLFNWCHLEQKRCLRSTSFDECDFEGAICAIWMNSYISRGG